MLLLIKPQNNYIWKVSNEKKGQKSPVFLGNTSKCLKCLHICFASFCIWQLNLYLSNQMSLYKSFCVKERKWNRFLRLCGRFCLLFFIKTQEGSNKCFQGMKPAGRHLSPNIWNNFMTNKFLWFILWLSNLEWVLKKLYITKLLFTIFMGKPLKNNLFYLL